MKAPSPRKSGASKRDQPDLPAEFAPPASLESGEVLRLQEQRIEDVAANLEVQTFQIEGSVLKRVQLAGSRFGSAVWKDVRFVGCDLANVRAHRLVLLRVEFVDCRLAGFSSAAVEWQDVLLQDCDLRYAQFQEAKCRNCEFEGCHWEDADLQQADLSGVLFRRCQLARADLRAAHLQNTDFRSSEIEGLQVGTGDLRGAIVDPAQAMILAHLLGLQIR